ncbi:MAG: hypothetical protein OER04_13620 [Cyclobacteriaceae bacterium]|nr:hypothetical protein [Cyclobacteriaceae bacterium]
MKIALPIFVLFLIYCGIWTGSWSVLEPQMHNLAGNPGALERAHFPREIELDDQIHDWDYKSVPKNYPKIQTNNSIILEDSFSSPSRGPLT